MLIKSGQIAQIKPRRLKMGGIIGIVAPASPFDQDELAQGRTLLHAMGFATQLAGGVFARKGFLAGSDTDRAEQIHAMFTDDHVNAIMCARGGYGSLRLLPLLDFNLIRTHPKPFIGFSDITALHHAIFQRCGLVTFHGPVVCTLAKGDPRNRSSFIEAVCTGQPVRLTADEPLAIKPGMAQGILVGGNLTTLCHLLGTPFAASYKGCLLFIEDTGEAPYRIDRMLVQMKIAGIFSGLSGIILGTFKACGAQADIHEIVRRLFDDCDIPILAGVGCGHGERNFTIPFGAMARLNADAGELTVLEAATVD